MSDSNLVDILFVRETAFAETPDQSKKLTELRFFSEELRHVKGIQESEEVRDDRSPGEDHETSREGAGTLELPFLCGTALDSFIEDALMGTFVTGTEAAVSCNISSVAQTVTRTSGTFTAAQQAAKYIKITGAGTSGNNGVKRIVSATTTVLTLAAGSLVGAETGVALTFDHKYVREGTTKRSYLLEKRFRNLSPNHFHYLIGMALSQLQLNMQPEDRVKAQLTFMGAMGISAAATAGDGAPNAASTNPEITTGAGIGNILYAGSAPASDVRSLQITLNNMLRRRPKLGQLHTKQPGFGDMAVSGTMEAYFEDKTMFQDFINHGSVSLSVPIIDSAGRLVNVHLPSLRFREGQPVDPGKNQDIITSMEWVAKKGTTEAYVIQIDSLSPS